MKVNRMDEYDNISLNIADKVTADKKRWQKLELVYTTMLWTGLTIIAGLTYNTFLLKIIAIGACASILLELGKYYAKDDKNG
jgi:hypothetical protein